MSKDVAWYQESASGRLAAEIKFVFRKWSGLEGKELEKHLEKVHSKAWENSQWPCVGVWTFVQKSISKSPHFDNVVSRLRSGGLVLDLGASFGHDLRLSAAHGVPTDGMVAIDNDETLWNLGYKMFLDHDRMRAKFFCVDFFADYPEIQALEGRFDVIIASQFFHLWSWQKQLDALRRCCALTKPGTLVIGFQRAQTPARTEIGPLGEVFMHSNETFEQIWHELGQQTHTSWDVEVASASVGDYGLQTEEAEWMPSGAGYMEFACRRTA